MSTFFKTLNLSHLEPLARMHVGKIPYSAITYEDDFYKLQHVYDVKWVAEHMASHYSCGAYIEALTGKEFPKEKRDRVIHSLKESEELSGPYLEKVKSGVLPSHEESRGLKQALSAPHSPVHIWCIEAVK